MKKKQIIIIPVLVVVGIFLIIGLFGISEQLTLKAGDCEKSYKHYYVEPFISNFLSCRYSIPCGTEPEEMTIYNAKVDVINCLCKNIETNKEIIIDYYNNIREFYQTRPSNDTAFICNGGVGKRYRQ